MMLLANAWWRVFQNAQRTLFRENIAMLKRVGIATLIGLTLGWPATHVVAEHGHGDHSDHGGHSSHTDFGRSQQPWSRVWPLR